MSKRDTYVDDHIPSIEAAGYIRQDEIENLIGWYGSRLCERERAMPASIYGTTYRGLVQLRDVLYGEPVADSEEKLPIVPARQLQILSLVSDKATRKFICTSRDEVALHSLVEKGALDEWYEITSLGRMLLR